MPKVNSNKGLVSVIIPTYNRANYIKRAIQSVKKDNYILKEIIIVDDGSTDKTKSVVQSIRNNTDTKIKYYSIRHSGASVARNFGLQVCKGQYILFLDSDDFLINDKILKSVEIFSRNPGLQIVYSDWYVEDEHGRREFCEADHRNIKNIVEGAFDYFTFGMQTTSPLWRASFLKKRNISWNEELICWQESVFEFKSILKLASTKEIFHLAEPLYVILYDGHDRMGSLRYSEDYILSELRAYHILYAESVSRGRGNAVKRHYAMHLKQLLNRCLIAESKNAYLEVLRTLSEICYTKKIKVLSVLPFEIILFYRRTVDYLRRFRFGRILLYYVRSCRSLSK